MRALECRRASLAFEREVEALEGLVCRACCRVCRRVGRSVVEGSEGMADGMLASEVWTVVWGRSKGSKRVEEQSSERKE